MSLKQLRLLFYVVLACSFTITSYLPGREARPVYSGLTAHEWGTFTSIAGSAGQAVEWYPHASRVEPAKNLFDRSLYQSHADGSITWDSVTLEPSLRSEFPRENRDNHYYAARLTSSTPLRVKTQAGDQQEKFLFYRGVSVFPVPLLAKLTPEDELLVENRSEEEIPNTILFERRGQKVGYRVGGAVQKETILEPPELSATIEDLGRDLEGMLVAQGLYQDEAHAMVETWRDSWFEEGSRLLYIVPAQMVHAVLPLSISPGPAQTVRVFVGRLEIVTPATEKAVERAFATQDKATLAKYSRFLEPILQAIIQKERNPARAKKLYENLNSFYNSEIAQNQRRN